MKLRNILTTALIIVLLLSLGANVWQYYSPRTIKGETVYLETDNLPPTAITTLPSGNQSATSQTQKDYSHKSASAKELLSMVFSIPDLENVKQITQLTSVNASLELALSEKDMVLNDKDKQLKEWKDKYNSVKVDNSTNTVDVNSEVSPKIANSEKREHWFAPKIPYTTITSENPAIKFYGVESYTFKNPQTKNILELTLNADTGQFLNDAKINQGLRYYDSEFELTFNPDGKFRVFGNAGLRTYDFKNASPYYQLGLKYLLIKL